MQDNYIIKIFGLKLVSNLHPLTRDGHSSIGPPLEGQD